MSRTGLLVVNLGTPDAPTTPAVRRYLRQFLSDPRVLDINPVGRWLLLNLIILPTRPAKSAHAYREIWTDAGSPLLVYGHALVDAMRQALPRVEVRLAMRYQNPSIEAGITALRDAGCDRLVVFPLYPQYASSSTGSTVEEVYRIAGALWNTPYVQVVPPYYEAPEFLDAFAAVARPVLEDMQPDHVLLSFHGLPERHMHKSDETGQHCLRSTDCCAAMVDANRNCYRAQCFATARGLAQRLDLTPDTHTVCFQSRLGRTPWIKPYTDEVLEALAKHGVKKLAVICPAFTADCLETLEEISLRNAEDFVAAGGEALTLVPSLNAHPEWVRGAVALVRGHLEA